MSRNERRGGRCVASAAERARSSRSDGVFDSSVAFARRVLDGSRACGVTLCNVKHAHCTTDRIPIFAIAAICLAVLGLALPRMSGPAGLEWGLGGTTAFVGTARIAKQVRGAATADSDRNLADDAASFAVPVARAADASAVLQRATEALERLPIELGWPKSRVLPPPARHDAQRSLVGGDPVRVAQREVAAQESPVLRWCLAHSTSSAIG